MCALERIYTYRKGKAHTEMTTKTSTKIRKHFESEIERATTIDELVYIETEFKPEMKLTCDDLLALCRISTAKKTAYREAGQRYGRAKKPAWR